MCVRVCVLLILFFNHRRGVRKIFLRLKTLLSGFIRTNQKHIQSNVLIGQYNNFIKYDWVVFYGFLN